jgi:methylamine--corrinoid protein Co-methyltransferase
VDPNEYNKILNQLAEELVKEHDIKIEPNSLLPTDGTLADSIYEAGFEMLLRNGLFCTDTGRLVKVTEEELSDSIKNAPAEFRVGEGNDACNVVHRGVGDSTIPLIESGPVSVPCSEEIYVKATQSYAQEPLVDLIVPSVITSVEGHPVAPHSPYEIKATRLEGTLSRMACALAGRPGMPLTEVPVTGVTAEARIAVDDGAVRPTDPHEISIMGELKIDLSSITVLSNWLQNNDIHSPESMPIFGGYLGGSVEKMAVLDVAAHLASFSLLSASIHDDGCTHIRWSCTTPRGPTQVTAHAGAAMSRNTHLVTADIIYAKAGPGTEMILFEGAAKAIIDTVGGRAVICGLAANCGVVQDHCDGLAGRMLGKIVRAAVKLNPTKANEIANLLIAKYDNKDYYKSAPIGKSFQECYDVPRLRPKEEYLRVYLSAMEKMEQEIGLKLL